MLWLICFFNYADRVAISSVLPVLEKQYGFNKTEQGMISAAFTWIYAAASPLAGHVGDRKSRKWVIIGGMYIWSAITGFTGACHRLYQFVFVRAAEGLGEAFYMPASMALVSEYHGPKTRSRAIGIHQTSIYAGTVFGGTAAGFLTQKYSWRVPFVCFAVAGCALGFVLSLFIRDRKQTSDKESTNEHAVSFQQFIVLFMKSRTAVRLVAAYFFTNIVQFVFLTWMPSYMKEKFHVSLVLAGFAGTVYIQLFSMIGAALGGLLADKRAAKVDAGRIQVQMAATLLGAPFIFWCGSTTGQLPLIAAMSMYGLFKGIYDASLTASFYDVIPRSSRATATGAMNLVGWIGAGLGAVLVGYAKDRNIPFEVSISSIAILYVISSFLLGLAAKSAPADMQLQG
jgi:MFS family permease